MRPLILTILLFTIAACGGESEPEKKPLPVVFGEACTGGSNDDDLCEHIASVYWCDDAGSTDGTTASSVYSQVSDTEPNDEITNAVTAHWPHDYSVGQRIGFGAQGSVDGTADVADFFAFTPERSADFYVSLCVPKQLCGPWTAEDRLDTRMATVRILDASGAETFSEFLQPGSANVFETRFEAGCRITRSSSPRMCPARRLFTA